MKHLKWKARSVITWKQRDPRRPGALHAAVSSFAQFTPISPHFTSYDKRMTVFWILIQYHFTLRKCSRPASLKGDFLQFFFFFFLWNTQARPSLSLSVSLSLSLEGRGVIMSLMDNWQRTCTTSLSHSFSLCCGAEPWRHRSKRQHCVLYNFAFSCLL